MEKAKFYIAEGPIYEGYTNGDHWNGWACPWFIKEVADQIAKEVNADAPYCTMHYDKENDAFIYKGYGEEEVGIFKGKDIHGKHLYPIGTAYWMWDKAKRKGGR